MQKLRWLTLGSLVALSALPGCGDDAKPASATPDVDQGLVDLAFPDARPDGAPVDLGVEAPDVGLLPDAGPLVDAATPPIVPVSVETRLGAFATTAGFANRVTCVVLDADGEPVDNLDTRFEVRPDTGWALVQDSADQIEGTVAGRYDVTCTVPSVGLRDASPERWDVLAGDVTRLVAAVDPSTVRAGEPADVTCTGTDGFGNPVDATLATVTVTPANAGVEVNDRQVVITTRGRYSVGCSMPGADEQIAAPLFVRPGLPAVLAAALRPDRDVYPVGVVVAYPALVSDAWGNRVDDADLRWTLEPALPPFGEGRYLAESEGRYTVSAQVFGDTHEGRFLAASDDFIVDAGGPDISCDDPVDGAMLTAAVGSRRALRVRVSDQLGVESLSIDGAEALPDGDGVFVAEVTTQFGLNAHEVVARDGAGNENSTFCSFVAAPRYIGEDAVFPDGIVLHLAQGAVDDGAPDAPIASLVDLIRRVVASPALAAQIDQALRAQNPIVPNDCRASLPFIGCIARFGAVYSSLALNGPNTVAANLVDRGLRVDFTVRNIVINGRSTGTISTGFRVTARSVRVVVTFDILLQNGRPVVRVRRTDAVEIGALDLDLPGSIGDLFDGVVNLVFGAFEGLVRDELAGAIEGFLQSEVDDLLSDVLNNLDLASLGVAFELPGLFGGPPTALSFGLGFSALTASPDRLRVGIGASINGPSRRPGPSAGVAVPPGPAAIELQPAGTVAAGVHVVVLNQALHRLWRAGLFDIEDAGALLGDLPAGVSLALRVATPPMVEGQAGETGVVLSLGPASGELVYPGLFDEPLRVRLAARATARVSLVGANTLAFEGLSITDLRVAFDAQMSPEARAALEGDLQRIVQAIMDSALNDALPDLPIPDFALPDALSEFGIPRGTRLGLRAPALTGTPSHLILDGRFGE